MPARGSEGQVSVLARGELDQATSAKPETFAPCDRSAIDRAFASRLAGSPSASASPSTSVTDHSAFVVEHRDLRGLLLPNAA